MSRFEGGGSTLEEALERICETHGIPREQLEYEVLIERKRRLGFLGRDEVRVRAWRKDSEAVDALEFLQRICRLAALRCAAELHGEDDETVQLRLAGEDAPLVVEREGELLDALQHVMNKRSQRGGARHRKVILDAQGFRERRADFLRQTALRCAEQVMATGQSAAVGPLNPHDRRLIHLELKEHPSVYTQSVGEGHFKKVVVAARKPTRGGDAGGGQG
jgi:spoIIIJ-associated protein